MAIVHVTEGLRAPVVRARAHICVMSLPLAQDAIAPLGALIVHMVSAVLLALTTVESPLSLSSPTIERVLVTLLLGYASDGGIIDEGGADSTTITPCRSSNVAVAGMVVVTSLVTSPYGVINMATIVCGSMCAGGGGRDSACGGYISGGGRGESNRRWRVRWSWYDSGLDGISWVWWVGVTCGDKEGRLGPCPVDGCAGSAWHI
jgi:hypothetical protein